MVATLIETPPVEIRAEAVAGLDAGFLTGLDAGSIVLPDGGTLTLDAGLLGLIDGGFTLPRQTIVGVFFGQRTSDDLTQAPTGIAGATVVANAVGNAPLTLKDQGSGTHQLTSQDEPSLVYEAHKTWAFNATTNGVSYLAEVEDLPEPERISRLHPEAGYIDLAAGSEYVLVRPDPDPGQQRNVAFLTVLSVSRNGQLGALTYSNVPTQPLEFLKLVAAPSDWQQTKMVIPGSAFPDADANYVIMLQSVRLGLAKSQNLFIGSAVIAGTADVGIVKTHR